MPPPTRLRRQAPRRVQQARITYLGRWMPGASRLTRAVTAAILDARGLLPEMPAHRRRRPRPSADPRQAVRDAR
jgi:hypothetical protein